MSCDYDVHCLDCTTSHGFSDANHEDKLMMAVAKLGPEIKAFAATMRKLDAETYGDVRLNLGYDRHAVDFVWFAVHGDHRLIAIDEYGRCVDECGEYYSYCECKHRKRCRRARGHDGQHAEERDAEAADVKGKEP